MSLLDQLTISNKICPKYTMGGYYYCMTGDVLHSTYFFYENGVIIHGGGNGPYTPPLEFIESQFKSESFQKSIHNTKSSWGVF